jgi:CheY-like chemotaxis protein
MFEQGERTVTRKYGGLGLGLAIAKMLIDLHRGASITAESDGEGRGSTFTIEFDTLGFERQDGTGPSVPAMRLVTSSAPKPLRLLLVEDHPDSRDMLALQLESAGYRVATAATVGEALELAGRGGFDLLISDIGLPDGTGLEVMQEVKERYGLRGIALSGFGTDEDVLKSKAAGFEHHVTKPVNFQTLQDIIERLAS